MFIGITSDYLLSLFVTLGNTITPRVIHTKAVKVNVLNWPKDPAS